MKRGLRKAEKHGLQNVANNCGLKSTVKSHHRVGDSMTIWESKGDGKVVGKHKPGGT